MGTRRAKRFRYVGGAPCLDLVNTVDWTSRGLVDELLTTYPDLARWGQGAGVLTERDVRQLRAEADAHPRAAERVLTEAHELRHMLQTVFTRIAQGGAPTTVDQRELNRWLGEGLARLHLEPGGGAFRWSWSRGTADLSAVLWPVVWSAGELLTSEEVRRIRLCGGEDCGWLFADRSRNRLRRWCQMETCGNRAKARRHYHRQQRASGGGMS